MSAARTPVQVAAAVFLRRDPEEFLLACRPQGKVYAGYWEFPGGKVEKGETVHEALIREIREELGVTVTQATPWLCRAFSYPHAFVHIHFWRVTDWEGEIGVTAPLEHSAIAWLPLCGPQFPLYGPQFPLYGPHPVAPMLPANSAILKALSLPCRMAITRAEEIGVEAELARLETALREGLKLVQLRDRTLLPALRLSFAEALMTLAQAHGALVLVSEEGSGAGCRLAQQVGAHGLHLTSPALMRCGSRPDFPWIGASCHDQEELQKAKDLNLDYVLLGPVLPTPSHPENPGLGWAHFAQLLENYSLPVFALGGQNLHTLSIAQAHGAHGIASLRHG